MYIVSLFFACLSIGSLPAYYDYSYSLDDASSSYDYDYSNSYSGTSTSSYNSDDSSSSGYSYTDNTKNEREEPLLGQTVQSPTKSYTLVRELGAGAFGKVFEATTTSGENFALKWYMPGGFSGWFGDHLADHNREFMLGQVLDHPHIIKSVESFADKEEDRPESNYTVLEFVPGKTLSSYSRGSLELPEAINATKQFISGVRHAFFQEYLHLDLHGNNVMLNKDQEVKIIDLSSFFSFEEIKEHCKSSEDSNETYTKLVAFKKIEQFAKRHPALKALNGYSSKSRTPISQYAVSNFDDVTEICIRIMLRAKMSREERMHIRRELKLIAWNCEADLEEGKVIHFETYLNSIERLLDAIQVN